MSKTNYSVLDEIEKKLSQFANDKNLAERSALVNSTLYTINYSKWGDVDIHKTVDILITNKSKHSLTRLSVLSWYLPENVGFLLRATIHDTIKNNSDLFELDYILKSKGHCCIWLSELLARKGAHYIFGNFLNKKEWSGKELVSLFRIKRTRNYKIHSDHLPEIVRIGVGYKDKGTLPADARGGMKNFMLTSVQNEIELNRELNRSLRGFFEGFLS